MRSSGSSPSTAPEPTTRPSPNRSSLRSPTIARPSSRSSPIRGHGGDFVRDVLVHQWPDDGKAVSALFAFDESDSTVTDPGDPVDVADARRSGAVMSAVAHAMSADSSWKLLSNIPRATDGGESIGQVNADLVRTVSHSMSPYIPHLAGANPENLPGGFDTSGWADPKDNNSFRGSANVFAALNTDEEAGRHFLGRAYAETAAAETRYGQDPPTRPERPEI